MFSLDNYIMSSSSQMNRLSDKFNNLITQYQSTYQDYINTISSTDASFTTVLNSSYMGENNINTIENSSINNCITSCGSTQECTGATFNNQQNTCILSGGIGTIINSSNQTAIIKQALFYSNKLQLINNELTNINKSMMVLANNNVNNFQQSQQNTLLKANILQQNYDTLNQERVQIAEIIRQYETINVAEENGAINVTANYYNYIVYFMIAIFLILLLTSKS